MTGSLTGPRLRWLRRQLGWTQSGLAKRLGIHRVTVANWERDAFPIPVMVAELLRCWYREHERRVSETPARTSKPAAARRKR